MSGKRRTPTSQGLAPKVRHAAALGVIGLLFVGHAICLAQLPAVPAVPAVPAAPAGVPTIWNKLGFRGGERIRNFFRNIINRRGNFPGLEGKPKLTSLTDPKNLKSDNPAIKAAAGAKAEADGAGQKVKAIKYLATVGCSRNGCFPGVKDALLAAFDDCTEEVRYEAVKAFIQTTGDKCKECRSTCCDKDTTDKLYSMAYGRDDEGCFLEISPRVRREAKKALLACCTPGEPGPEPELPSEGPAGPEETPEKPEPPESPEASTAEHEFSHDSAFSFLASVFSSALHGGQRDDAALKRRFAPEARYIEHYESAPRVSSTYAPRAKPRRNVVARSRQSDPLDIRHTDPSEAPHRNGGRQTAGYERDAFDHVEPEGDEFSAPRWRQLVDRFQQGRYEQTDSVEPYSGRPTRPYKLQERLPSTDQMSPPQYTSRDPLRYYDYDSDDAYPSNREPAYQPPSYEPPAIVDQPYRPGSTGQVAEGPSLEPAVPAVASSLPPTPEVIERAPPQPPLVDRRVPPSREKIESTFAPPMPVGDDTPVGPSPQPKEPPVVPTQEQPRDPQVWPPAESEPQLPPSPKPIANLKEQERLAVRYGTARPLVRFGAVRAIYEEPSKPVVADREVPQPDHLKRAEYTPPQREEAAQRATYSLPLNNAPLPREQLAQQPAAPRLRLGGARALPMKNALPPRVASQRVESMPLGPGRYESHDLASSGRYVERETHRYDERETDRNSDPGVDRYVDRYAERDAKDFRDTAAEIRLDDPRSSTISIDDRDAGRAHVEQDGDRRGVETVADQRGEATPPIYQGDDQNVEPGYLRSRVRSWFR